MSRDQDKKGILGDVMIKLQESRELKLNYFAITLDQTSRKSAVHAKAAAVQSFEDEVEFQVTRMGAKVQVEAFKTGKAFLADKCIGELFIDLTELKEAGKKGIKGWRPLYAKKKEEDVINGSKKKKAAADEPKVGEVRLEARFKPNKKLEDKLKGRVLSDQQWTVDNAVASIINNPRWHEAPQYLLTVESDCQVRLRLKPEQQEDKTYRVTYYVIEYDMDFWKGSKKRWYTISEIVKVDNFNSPIAAPEIDTKVDFSQGHYIVVAVPEEKGQIGKFAISADTATVEDINFQPLPLEDAQWTHSRTAGKWDKKTAGGGDITGISWTNNPQYTLSVKSKRANVCIVLNQETDEKSIGWYLIDAPSDGKKAIEYTDEIATTSKFKATHMNGQLIEKLPKGDYVIIPATFEPEQVGNFTLDVFSEDPGTTCEQNTNRWENRKILKGKWSGNSAGGSANNPASFVQNPQFLVKLPERQDVAGLAVQIIQSCQRGEEESLGFLAFVRNKDEEGRLTEDELDPDTIFLQPEAWTPARALTVRTKIKRTFESNLLIIPATFTAGVNRSFKLVIYADFPIEVEELTDGSSESSESE